jgi:AcrR family transcriptional regulator
VPRTPRVQLAGEAVAERHVSVLHHGTDELFAQLGPFIVEGFDAGDHQVHLVQDADAHRDRLARLGIDPPALESSGQLDIREWTDPLRSMPTFTRPGMLEYVRHNLDLARSSGWDRTRWVATMEWAPETFPSEADFIRFESQLDDLVRSRRDVIVCAFDLPHHSASEIAGVIDAHALTLAGDVLRPRQPLVPVSARERILTAAHDHFHNLGIRATGVDTLIEEAGVAKATFYRHFPSKDDLVVAWLRDDRPRWFYAVRDRAEAAAQPGQVIPMIFEEMAHRLEEEGYRGCAFQNAAAEITEVSHPALPIIREYFNEIEAYFREVLAGSGREDAADRAAELAVLLAGGIAASVAKHDFAPALVARDAAERLLAPR